MKTFEVSKLDNQWLLPIKKEEMHEGYKSIKDRFNHGTIFVGSIIEFGLHSKEPVKIVLSLQEEKILYNSY